MNLIKLGAFALLVLYSLDVTANESFIWSLNKDSKDKNETSKPATIQYTSPDEGKSSYAIDAALKATYTPKSSDWEYSIAAEKHKNTLIKKPQDLSALSASMETSWGSIENGYVYIPDFSVSYKSDSEKDTDSILFIAEITGIWGNAGINKLKGSNNFKWYWAPTIALEYEDMTKSNNGIDGKISRLYSDFNINIYPYFKKLDDGRLSFFLSYSNWQDLSEDSSIDTGKDSHDLASYGFSWRLTSKPLKNEKKFAVFLEFTQTDGEDIRNNKDDQKYSEISIGFQY